MNRKSVIFSLVVVSIILTCTMTSCSEKDQFDLSSIEVKPAKIPDFRLYSGNTVFTSSLDGATRATINGNFFKIQDFGGGKSEWMESQYPILYRYFDNAPATTDRGEFVSQAEYEAVMAYLAAHPDEGGTTCDLTTYFIQHVGTSNKTYQLFFMNGEAVHHDTWIHAASQMNYVEFDEIHINDYNATYGPRALCVNIPLVNPRYRDSYAWLMQENHYRFYTIEFQGQRNLYLCFDYATTKYDNGLLDYQGDGVYDDWVIKITPADGSEIPAESGEGGEGGGSVEAPDSLDFYSVDHVEVNLSVNDKHDYGDWIHTKLSIHIRSVTDVELFIPVSQQYYCDMDDMDIVISHELGLEKYIPQPSTEMYSIVDEDTGDSYDVGATVTFESSGIRITTTGMTAGLQEYLQSKYGDGLTFEIWNYYDVEAIDRETLKPYLDATSVTFSGAPTLFVNAFAPIGEDDHKNPWDCVVTPPSDYSFYGERTPSVYYDYNIIYKR